MSFLSHIELPETPAAEAIRRYLTAQEKHEFLNRTDIFTEDAIFNGLLFKVKGRNELNKGFQDFVSTMVSTIRIEAVSQVGSSDQWLVLFFIILSGATQEVPIVDLVTVKDGLVSRVDNCFDTSKMTPAIVDEGKKTSNM